MNLSVSQLRQLKPQTRQYRLHDSHGLSLEVMPTGLKSWRFRYFHRGRRGIVTLGHYPAMGLAAARKRRDELLAGIRAGRSPATPRITVKAFSEQYLRDVVAKKRADMKPVSRYLVRSVWPLIGHRPIAAVTQHDLRELIFAKRERHEQAALALYHLLKRLWNYALACGAVEVNPLLSIPAKFVGSAHSRARSLSEAELRLFLRCLDSSAVKLELRTALKLILLTLVRKSELRRAAWSEFDLERAVWEIPAEHDKMKRGHIVYLSRQACDLLSRLRSVTARGCVFAVCDRVYTSISASTLNRALQRLTAKQFKPFTIHDLRRTAATRLAELGYAEAWIEKTLNHKKRGVAGIYNRAEYADQRRGMLQAWADYLDSLRAPAQPEQG
ncbi:MAG: tyrosine-type recombinase/integrase [Acidobacteriaceae bacterium]